MELFSEIRAISYGIVDQSRKIGGSSVETTKVPFNTRDMLTAPKMEAFSPSPLLAVYQQLVIDRFCGMFPWLEMGYSRARPR